MLQTYRQGALHTPNSAYGELSAAQPRKAEGGAGADKAATGVKRGKEVCVVELEGRRCRLVRLDDCPDADGDPGEITQFEFEGCCYALFADPLPDRLSALEASVSMHARDSPSREGPSHDSAAPPPNAPRAGPPPPSSLREAARRTNAPAQMPNVDMRAALTMRELQIVQLVCMGCLTKQIAARLHISEFTVRSYLKTIYCKAGVRCRAALVFSYMQACAGAAAEDAEG